MFLEKVTWLLVYVAVVAVFFSSFQKMINFQIVVSLTKR